MSSSQPGPTTNNKPDGSRASQPNQQQQQQQLPTSEVGRRPRSSPVEEIAHTTLRKQIHEVVIDFAASCHRRGIWEGGDKINDGRAVERKNVAEKIAAWVAKRHKAGALGSVTTDEDFCNAFLRLNLTPNLDDDDEKTKQVETKIRDKLWPQIKKCWAVYEGTLAASDDLEMFVDKFGAWIVKYKVLASAETARIFRHRFIRVDKSSRNTPWLFERPPTLAFSETHFEQEHKKVLIIRGPSGSGKSILSLQYAFFRDNNVVFFLNGCIAGWTENVEESEKGLSREEMNQIRNKKALNAVVQMITAFLGDPTRFKNTSVETASSPHVVFVFDEVGETPRFVRALCSASAQIAEVVSTMLFGDDPDHQKRIHFIAAGTGANAVINEPGSTTESYQVVELVGNSTIYSKLVEQHFGAGTRIRTLLERLTLLRPQTSSVAPAVQHGEDSAKPAPSSGDLSKVTTALDNSNDNNDNDNDNNNSDNSNNNDHIESATLQESGGGSGIRRSAFTVRAGDTIIGEDDDQRYDTNGPNELLKQDNNDESSAVAAATDTSNVIDNVGSTVTSSTNSHDVTSSTDTNDSVILSNNLDHGSVNSSSTDDKIAADKNLGLPRCWSPNEQLCADFVTNPRACVLFLQQPLELWPLHGEASDVAQSMADSFSTYDQLIGTWIIKATTGFLRLNGLRKFTKPVRALRFAFVADVFRLPFLPLDKDLIAVVPSVLEESFTLPFALSTKGGILVDSAQFLAASRVSDSVFDLHRVAFPPSNAQNDDDGSSFTPDIDVPETVLQPPAQQGRDKSSNKEQLTIIANKSGRYKVDVAQGSMLRLLDGVSARDDDWATLETRFAEFGKAVGGSSRFIELIMSKFSPTRLAQLQLVDEKINSKVDPLFHLKQWLRFGEDITGAVMYRLAVSGLGEYDKFCRVADAEYAHCVRQLKKVVVLIPNKEKESFADVIFLGPGKVILLQIKRLTSVHSSINFNDEFLKMCAVSEEQHDEVGDDFVTEIRAVVPHRKQQMTDEQFDAAKQEYEKNKRTVALHKEYVNLANKRNDAMEADDRKKCEADYAALAKLLAPKIKHHLRRRFLRKLTDLCRVASSPSQRCERQTDAAATESPDVRVYCGVVLGLSLPDADDNKAKCSEELAKYMKAFNGAKANATTTETNDGVKVVGPLAKGPGFKVEDLKFFCFDARNTNPLHPLPLYVSESSQLHKVL